MTTLGALNALKSRITGPGLYFEELNVRNKKSFKKSILEFNDDSSLLLTREGDIYNPKSILFINPSEDFRLKYFIIESGGSEILRLDIGLCGCFKNDLVEKYNADDDNIIQINLPWKELKLDNMLKMVALQYHQIIIKIEYEGVYNNSYLLGYYSFHDTEERRMMAQVPHEMIIPYMQTTNINHQGENPNYSLYINGLVNGLFFKNIDFYNIRSLKISLDGEDFIEINKLNWRTFMKKINDFYYYLPFDDNLDYFNINLSSAVNCTSIENIVLTIDSNECDFEVGYRSVNVLRMASGMCGLAFKMIRNSNSSKIKRINKKLGGDIYCSVNMVNIKDNDEYLNCKTCNKNFLKSGALLWIQQKKKCPHCRSSWSLSSLIIYKNCE